VHQQTLLFKIAPVDFFSVCQQTQLLDSKTMLSALRGIFGNLGQTSNNKSF